MDFISLNSQQKLFRLHRGGLHESISDSMAVNSCEDLLAIVISSEVPMYVPEPTQTVNLEYRHVGPDKRINWEDVWMVLVSFPGSGEPRPCGFINFNPETCLI